MKMSSENEDADKSVPQGSRNVSQEIRDRLISKIKEIDRVNPEERIDEIKKSLIEKAEHDNQAKLLLKYIKTLESREGDLRRVLQRDLRATRYGLVFEEHREEIDDKLESHLPVLVEKKERLINNGGPVNFLLEGDNLASLQILERTHTGKIDLIYIDPPYNTGKKDFVFGDSFVERTDSFRHSKWLSFMSGRLEIAKKLLADSGVIFISIDDNEQAALKLLCDDKFGYSNFIADIIWENREGGGSSDSKFFKIKHEHILCYAKNINSDGIVFHNIPIEDAKRYRYSDAHEKERGKYQLVKLASASLQYSESLDYGIVAPDGTEIFPKDNTDKGRASWRWGKDKLKWGIENDFIVWKKDKTNTYQLYTKQYINCDKDGNITERKTKPYGVIAKYSSTQGSNELFEIFGEDGIFSHPKPSALIKYLIERFQKDDMVILDFFAGSGTTGDAVLQLNKEDGGKRRFILCTNNETLTGNEEDGICRKVTYERIRRVIERENYEATLKYFQIDFVPIVEKQEGTLLPLLYEEYEGELLLPACSLVELENAINFTGNAEVAIARTQEELDSFISSLGKNNKCKVLYVGLNVSLGGKEKKELLTQRSIKVKKIPDCYYRDFPR